MHSHRAYDRNEAGRDRQGRNSVTAGSRLRSAAAILLSLASCLPSSYGQEPIQGAGAKSPDKSASALPAAPAPVETQALRTSLRDYSKAYANFIQTPLQMYRPTDIPKASFTNSVRLNDLVKNGNIYLSLSDAIALAIENNYDMAIARYNLDIADTDILRTRTGALPLGAPSGLVTGTLGGSPSVLSTGGGPGGTTVGAGGAGSGVSGLTLTTAGAGPAPPDLDPNVTGTIQFERAFAPQANRLFSGGKPVINSNTNTYTFGYNQGFVTGTTLAANIINTRVTTDNPLQTYSPYLNSIFKATVTQHLLQGAGIWVNKRFMYQALNDKRITNSSFRQQVLYTVNQVETIYWGLVQAYEDVQAKQRALEQSTQLLSDNQKQLQIGSMAPLDVVNAQSTVATDKQALISAQNTLNYQQQVIKQAIARNLNDPMLSSAPVIPTDRVSLEPIPEEAQQVESLVQEAFKQRPELEQAALTVSNDEITLKGARNALLPTLDVYGFYGSSALGGAQNPGAYNFFTGGTYPPGTFPTIGYGTVFQNLYNSSAPDKGVGFTLNVPIRDRYAQSVQERSLMEHRQAELRLEQLYTQIRMQVVNSIYALSNDRAAVQAAEAARDFNQQSLDAEVKKLRLGASTTANVLQQQRNLATAEANMISAEGNYAKDRAGLYQITASTLQHYGINLEDAAKGVVEAQPTVQGVKPAPAGPPTSYLRPDQMPQPESPSDLASEAARIAAQSGIPELQPPATPVADPAPADAAVAQAAPAANATSTAVRNNSARPVTRKAAKTKKAVTKRRVSSRVRSRSKSSRVRSGGSASSGRSSM